MEVKGFSRTNLQYGLKWGELWWANYEKVGTHMILTTFSKTSPQRFYAWKKPWGFVPCSLRCLGTRWIRGLYFGAIYWLIPKVMPSVFHWLPKHGGPLITYTLECTRRLHTRIALDKFCWLWRGWYCEVQDVIKRFCSSVWSNLGESRLLLCTCRVHFSDKVNRWGSGIGQNRSIFEAHNVVSQCRGGVGLTHLIQKAGQIVMCHASWV